MMRTLCRISLLASLSVVPFAACTGGSSSSSSSSSGGTGGSSSGGSGGGSSSGGGGSSAVSHASSASRANSSSRTTASSNGTSGATSDGTTSSGGEMPLPYVGGQERGVVCESMTCDPATTNTCCVGLGGAPTCEANTCSGFGFSIGCDGPEDCDHVSVCCADTLTTSCKAKTDCTDAAVGGMMARVCGQDADCEAGQGCCTVTGLVTMFLTGVDFGTCQVGCGGGTSSSSSSGGVSSSAAPASSGTASSAGASSTEASSTAGASSSDGSSSASAASAGSSAVPGTSSTPPSSSVQSSS